MKKYIGYIMVLGLLFCFSCADDDIVLSKEGELIGPVSNLKHSESGDDINLTWDLPTDFPDDVIQPVSVQIKITIDGQNKGTEVLANAPESYTFSPYESSKEYRFTVKVMASVDTTDPAVSDLRYSLGQTVAF